MKKLLAKLFPQRPVLGHVEFIKNRQWKFGESEHYLRIPVVTQEGNREYLLLTPREYAQGRIRVERNPEDCPKPSASSLWPIIRVLQPKK